MTPEMAGRRSEVSWPRQTAGIKLKVGGRKRLRHESFTVDAIEGDVVTVKTGDGQETSIREGGDLSLWRRRNRVMGKAAVMLS